MRIAYCGNFDPEFSTENDVKKAWEHLGHEVITLQENRVSIEQVREAGLNSDLFLITGTWDSLPLMDMLDFYHDCAVRGIPTATLHLDTFWSTSRHSRKWWRESMFHTAYIFTADGDYQDEWKALGKNHIWLPPAVRHDAAKFGNFREEYACDVAFVGSNGVGYHNDVWNYRKELVDFLRSMCQRNGWTFKNPGGDDPKISRGDDMNDFYASASVTVGDSLCLKKESSQYWSDRVPEATGRGGLLIMPRIKALAAEGWDLPQYEWGNYNHLEDIVKSYLKDEKLNSKTRVINASETAKNHTYVNRAETILKEVGL